MEYINTLKALHLAGCYSQVVVCNGMVYVSGQFLVDTESASMEGGSIEKQTLQALRNVEQILLVANRNIRRVVRVTVYISDINLWEG